MGNIVSNARKHTRRATNITGDPRLPRELERAIFELAALSYPICIPDLLLVALRVKEWTQPLLHHTVFIDNHGQEAPIDGLRSYDPWSFHLLLNKQPIMVESVRTAIFLGVVKGTMERVLSACPRVQNLYVIKPSEFAPPTKTTLDKLPLRELYCNMDCLPSRDFSCPAFANLSRLELFRNPSRTYWSGLVRLQWLTHLALNDDDVTLSQLLLKKSKSLRLLVILKAPKPDRDYSPLASDPRFVMMKLSPRSTADWQRSALYGDDYWERAEDFIAKRRAGQPPPDPQYPFHLM